MAVKLFNERGYDGTSMEDLARRLGITKSAIYHHVTSKQELLRLAVNRALDGLFAEAAQLEQVDGRAIDRLEYLVRGSVLVLRTCRSSPCCCGCGATPRSSGRRCPAAASSTTWSPTWRPAAADGDLRADIDPAVTARLLFGLVNSLIEWYRPRGGRGRRGRWPTLWSRWPSTVSGSARPLRGPTSRLPGRPSGPQAVHHQVEQVGRPLLPAVVVQPPQEPHQQQDLVRVHVGPDLARGLARRSSS